MKVINLLPKPRQEELRFQLILRNLFIVMWLTMVSFALVFLVQFAVKLYLQNEASLVQNRIDILKITVSRQENAEVRNKIKAVNDAVSDYKNLADSAPKWSKVLAAFSNLPPEGVKISTFTVDLGRKSINITGFAPTRELVIALYNSILQDQQDFYNINYPLENIIQPTNISFHFTFFIRDELLK